MALPVIENNSSIVKSLNENADRLEEIKQITISGPTTGLLSLNQQTLDEIKILLSSQLDLDKQAAELQRLQLENQENAQRENELEAERAARLARESAARQAAMQGGTGATASAGGGNWLATALGIGRGAAAAGGLVAALKTGLLTTLGNVTKGGLLVGLGNMFGDEIGKFLGENVATALNQLGLNDAFGNKIGDFLTEKAGGIITDAGWSKILFGRTLPGIIASTLVQSFGLPSLSEKGFMDEVGVKIGEYFGEGVAEAVDKATSTIGAGSGGALLGYLIGGIAGKRGKIIGAIAGYLFQYFGLDDLADPAKKDEVLQNIEDDTFGRINEAGDRIAAGFDEPTLGQKAGVVGASTLGVAAVAARLSRPGNVVPQDIPQTTPQAGPRATGRGRQPTFRPSNMQMYGKLPLVQLEELAVKKFPRLSYLKKVPGIGSVISLTSIYYIAVDDSLSMSQKAIEMTGVFGGLLGSAIGPAILGAIVGILGGAPTGPGAVITGLIGVAGGYYAGEALVTHIVEYLLGLKGDINDLPKKATESLLPESRRAVAQSMQPPRLNPVAQTAQQTSMQQPSMQQPQAATSQSQTPSLPSVGSLDTSALSSLPSSTDLQSMDLTRQRIDRKYEGITKALNQAMGLSEEGRPANEVAAEALEAVQEASAQGLLSDTILEPGGILGEETLRVYTADQRKSVADMFTNHKEKVDAFLSLDNKSQELVLDRPQIDVLRNVSVRLESSVRRINAAQVEPTQATPAQATPDTPVLSDIPVSAAEQQPIEPTGPDQLVTDLGVLQQAANAFPAGDPRRMEYENEIQNKAAQLKELYTVTTATASAIPPVDRNEVSELSKQLSTSSQVVIAQPVTNVVNNINNDNSSTSVASSGSGTNIPSGRTYNIDSSLTRVNRGRVYA
jgi:hypothetical protein